MGLSVTAAALFFPVFVQVLLTFVMLGAMARARTGYLKAAKADMSKVALGHDVYPDRVKKIQNNFHNQLELPILFYAVTLFAIALGKVDTALVAMAWVFAASRIAHALVQTGSNSLPARGAVFGVGALILLIMWAWLAVKIAAF